LCFLLKYFMMDVKTIFMGLLDMKFRYGGGNGKNDNGHDLFKL